MDFNIGAALKYASKGEGVLFDTSFYQTDCFKEI